MSTNTTELVNTASDLLHELTELERTYGEDRASWPAGKREHAERLEVRLARLTEQIETATAERAAKIDAVRQAAAKGNVERYEVHPAGTRTRRGDPWHGLDRAGTVFDLDTDAGLRTRALDACERLPELGDAARQKLATMIDRDRTSESAAYVLALGAPAYSRAFTTWLRDPATAAMASTPEEQAAWRDMVAVRTALNETGGAALIPLQLDPAVVLTNVGSASGVRRYASVKQTATNQWRGVKSPGVTAEFKAEGSEAADATPTLSAIDVSVLQGFASITSSWELLDDTDLASQLAGMITDARANQEASAFVTGAGTTEPWGAVTRVAATTASRVNPTTGGTFTVASVNDVFAVRDALPARHRQSPGVAWAANISILSLIQRMSPDAAGSSFWANLNEATPPTLLGIPVFEATAMASAVTTGSVVLALVNWADYFVVDRLGTSVTVTNVQGGSNRSTGQTEFAARWRYGADLGNVDAGRALRL